MIRKMHEDSVELMLNAFPPAGHEYDAWQSNYLSEIAQVKQSVALSAEQEQKYMRSVQAEMYQARIGILKKHHVLSLCLTQQQARKKFNEQEKARVEQEKQQKLLHGPHAGSHHLPAPHDRPAHVSAPGIRKEDDVDAQMSHDKALWGAATHTRAGDSLKYL